MESDAAIHRWDFINISLIRSGVSLVGSVGRGLGCCADDPYSELAICHPAS